MMAHTVADVLAKAADLIEPEGAWTQKAIGRDDAGVDVGNSKELSRAVCYCAAGAIWIAASMDDDVVQRAFSVLNNNGATEGVGPWNDKRGRTQSEAVDFLRKAAALARDQGK